MFILCFVYIHNYGILKLKKVDYNIANQRFDRYLRKYFKPYPDIKLSDIYSWIRKWAILINNKKAKEDYRLILWDEIKFNNIETGKKKPTIFAGSKSNKMKSLTIKDIKKIIIYEDDNRIVFDKPAGIVAHPSNKHINDLSMNDYLDRYCQIQKIHQDSETFKVSFCFRLDKDTSWILVAAKNYKSLQYLNDLIRNRQVDKEYMTIVEWNVQDHMTIEKPISKTYNKKFGSSRMSIDPNWLESKTEFWRENNVRHAVLGPISVLRVKLYTGRMHQIRIHLASEWYKILWDIIYWNPVLNRKMYKELKINRQILHCSRYSFVNLDGNLISFEADLPLDFQKLINQ